MALRKALTYSKWYARPYTRVSKKKSKSYIKVVPHNKVVKYNLGNIKAFIEGKYPFFIRLITNENIQIRDTAIEAGRQLLVKQLDEKLPNMYYLEIKIHPHHILRNNKMAAGAGADRLSSGMSQSFGSVEGRAAIVKKNHNIFIIHTENDAHARVARDIMTMVKAKLPCSAKIIFEHTPVTIPVTAK